MKVVLVRGKFLNRYEMQFFEPLTGKYNLTAFGSLTSYHDAFRFPVVKLISPMDLPNFPYKMPILNRLFTDAHYLYGLEDRLRGFDLVHTAETYFHYTQQCLNAKRRGLVRNVIATVLENIPFNNEGIRGRKAYKLRARSELDHIIALTKKTKEALLLEGADEKKITVISHFVDTARFRPAPDWQSRAGDTKKRRFTILFTGRLEAYKGVHDIMDAAMKLEEDASLSDYVVHWRFVGLGGERNALREKIFEKRKNWHSTFESATYDQMPAIYREADIFVAPSKAQTILRRGIRIPTWEEQYCTALLEAQAVGLPIVTTTSGGIPENVGDAALLVPPGDASGIASALRVFLTSPKTRVMYANRARDRALTVHDIHIGAGKIEVLYERVLRR